MQPLTGAGVKSAPVLSLSVTRDTGEMLESALLIGARGRRFYQRWMQTLPSERPLCLASALTPRGIGHACAHTRMSDRVWETPRRGTPYSTENHFLSADKFTHLVTLTEGSRVETRAAWSQDADVPTCKKSFQGDAPTPRT